MTTTQTVGTPRGSSTIETRPEPALRLTLPSGTLRLRAEPAEERHIQWAEDVIDNEGMGKRSSKGMFSSHTRSLSPIPKSFSPAF